MKQLLTMATALFLLALSGADLTAQIREVSVDVAGMY